VCPRVFFKDLSHEAKVKAKDSTLKAKAKTNNFKIVLEDPRGRGRVLEDSNTATQPPYLYDLYSASSWSQHTLFTLCQSHQNIIVTQSLTASSDMLHLIFGTSFLHHSGFLIRITHPPLSDLHWNMPILTCYTLLSPSITFSLFHSELKTYLFRKSYPQP